MPLLRRKPFTPNPLPPNFDQEKEYFVCKATGEVFEDYEEFYERVIVCNSLLWTCSITAKPNLTYAEAKACEKKALNIIEQFPTHLKKPVLHLARLTHRTRINDLNDDVYVYIRDVYFNNEAVEAIHQEEWWEGRVIESFLATSESGDTNGYNAENGEKKEEERAPDEPDWDHIRYKVQLWDDEEEEYIEGEDGFIIVDTSCIRREKSGPSSINQDKCKMFLKYHCEHIDGVWTVKPEFVEKYNMSESKFSDYVCLDEPQFTKSKAPVKKSRTSRSAEDIELIKEAKNRAKAEKEARALEMAREKKESKVKKEAKEKAKKLTPEERAALKEKARVEREKLREEAAARLAEEKARLREIKEQERQKAKEEKKLLADKLREWNKPRDDLLCDDLAAFPSSLAIPPRLSPHFADVVMISEFLSVFGEHLGLESRFPDGVSLDVVEKALFETDINGPLSDLLCFFLAAIFACTEEEEEEEMEQLENQGSSTTSKADIIDETTEPGELTFKELLDSATAASQLCQLTHGISLKDFQLDPLTVSEMLRLHLLASGAKGSSASVKFRYQSRGGYTSLDDAGIELKKDHPHLLQALNTGNVFDLDPESKITILSTLINQLLSFASLRDIVEEAMDQYKSVSYELKQLQWAEQRREREEAQYRHKRKLEQKLAIQQTTASSTTNGGQGETGPTEQENMDTDQPSDPAAESEPSIAKPEAQKPEGVEAAKAAKKLAKKILNETSRLDPAKLASVPDNRTRRKNNTVAVEDIDWAEFDMTEWNTLEERFLSDEDIETLNSRRKEIEARKKQVYIEKEAEMFDKVCEWKCKTGTQSLGKDRWGRNYWQFNSIPGLFVETDAKDVINVPCDLDTSTHSEKENMPVKQEARPPTDVLSTDSVVTNGATEPMTHNYPNSVMENDPSYAEGTNWVYYNTIENIDQVIGILNNRGYRESALKLKLAASKRQMQQQLSENPDFHIDEHSVNESDKPTAAATNQNIKSKSRIVKGLVQNTTAQESLELNLREMLLDLEERIFVGGLGYLKVNDRAVWRSALEDGSYDPQDRELSFLPTVSEQRPVSDMEIDDCHSLVVRDLSRALIQLFKSVEPKYLTKPLGTAESGEKRGRSSKKKKEEQVESSEQAADSHQVKTADRWVESLCHSASLSQVFLHLYTLETSIVWSKSALNARCKICRRKGDGEKMLLCDMCDRGHHMYCLKPVVKEVPKGDWFCPECRPKTTKARRASRRKSFYDDEMESVEDNPEKAGIGGDDTADDSVYDEDTATSSDNEEIKHPKVKLLKNSGKNRKRSASPASPKETNRSRRSRTSTPDVEAGRSRRSAAPSPEPLPAKRSKGSAKHDSNRKSKGSRPSSPSAEKGRKNGLGASRASSEEVAQLAQCEELVKEMMEKEDCWPFLQPVNKKEVPDYYTIIKHPMDCQTIMSKVKTCKYTHVSEMLADVRQMFKNCAIYNEDDSDIFRMGEKMSKYFEKNVKSLRLDPKKPRKV